MRRTFTMLIALMALCISSWATVTQQKIGDFWYELDDSYNVATLIKLPGSDEWASYELTGDITIPGTVNDGVSDYTVTTIGTKAFVSVGITSVTIEEGVTDINESAFFGSSLQTATLPSTITYLGHQSFDYTALTAFVITATSPASFGSGDPFSNVSTLEHIYVPAASVDAYKAAWTSYASLIEEKPVWVTWNQTDVESVNLVAISEGETSSQTVKDITVTASSPESGDYAVFSTNEYGCAISIHDGGTLTFAPTSGKLKGISISCGGYASYSHLAAGSGWTWNSSKYTLEWSGEPGEPAESVVLACDGSSDGIYFGQNTSIVFTLEAEEEPAPAVTITTVIWDTEEVATISLECSNVDAVKTSEDIDGIIASLRRIASGGNCEIGKSARDLWMDNNGELTFISSVGNISAIVITSDHIYTDPYNLPAGWIYDEVATTLTWAGAASSQVTLSGNMDFLVSSIEFTVESAAAPAEPVSQEPVTWDFVNDEELANLYLRQYTHYNFHGYYQEYYDNHYEDTVKNFKGIVATISAMTDGSYACFSNQNNYSIDLENGGTLTFSTELGQFQSIVINTTSNGSSSGDWTWVSEEHTLTWAGTPANSVVLDDIDISDITSIVFTFVSAAPAFTADITWDATEVATVSLYGSSLNTVVPGTEIDGITPSIMKTSYSGSYCYFASSKIRIDDNGELIFTSSVGDIQGIVLTFDNTESYTIYDFPVGWTLDEGAGTLTWTGTAAEEVSLSGYIHCTVSSIEFDVIEAPAPVYPTPSGPSFIWQSRQVSHVLLSIDDNGASQTTHVIKNVITSLERTAAKADEYDFCLFANKGINIKNNGTLTFRSIVGDLTGIVITCGYKYYADDLSADWRYDSENGTLIWVGTPAETVTLSGHVDVSNISSIEFFYNPAPAPRKGVKFFGIYKQYYQITGAHTAKLPAQDLNHTLDIPEYVDYEDVRYYVTEIADYAFYGQAELPNVLRGVNIAKIGAHAFDGCIQITDISLQSDVLDTIGTEAFKNCKLMSNFDNYTELPPVLGSNAFSGTTYLNRIRVNSSYTVDAYTAATNWSEYSDKIVTLWENPAIGEEFFWSNQMTTNWYAVSSVTPVKEAKVLPYSAAVEAIYPATRYGRLVIPEEIAYLYQEYKVTGIGENAYKDSTRFYMVMIPQAVKSIESGAFLNCTGVENVQFLWDDPTEVTWADATVGAEFKTAASGETKICVPKGTLAAYQAWAPAWASCMVEGEILDIDVTASEDPNHASRYYRTFYDSETDYLMPPSVWAHAGYVENGTFILSPVAFDGMVLPRGTAVVLESETPTYRLVPVGNTAPIYDGRNDLVGTDVDIARTSVGNNGENVYVLNRQANIGGNLYVGMGMYQYTGTTLGAHKAYLIYDAPSGPNNAPARFVFKHKNEPTDVENVQDTNASCTKILRNGQLIIIKDGKEYNAQGLIIK